MPWVWIQTPNPGRSRCHTASGFWAMLPSKRSRRARSPSGSATAGSAPPTSTTALSFFAPISAPMPLREA